MASTESKIPAVAVWDAITGKPELPEGISAETVLLNDSSLAKANAEARHAAGLAQVNADGGFFDAFVDASKISSKSDIIQKTGTNGFIELGLAGTGNTQTESNNRSLSGFNDEFTKLTPSTKSIVTSITFTPAQDFSDTTLRVKDSNNNVLASKDFGSVTADTQYTGSFSISDYSSALKAGKSYIVELDESGGANTVYTDAVSITGTIADFSKTPDDGSVTVEEVSKTSSGKTSSNTFKFTDSQGNSFTPSKVGAFPEYDASGANEDVEIKLIDSNNNVVKTITESDFGKMVDVSTTDTQFTVEVVLSRGGSSTPQVSFLDVRGV